MASLAAETLNLKGFRVRQWLINQFLSQKLFTRYTLRIDRTSSEIVARSNEPTFVPFFFFFFFFFIFEAQDKKSSRPIGKRLEKNCAFFVHCHLQTYPPPLFPFAEIYDRETLLFFFFNGIRYVLQTEHIQWSTKREKLYRAIKNWKFFEKILCGNILFFGAKSKVFVRNAKRIYLFRIYSVLFLYLIFFICPMFKRMIIFRNIFFSSFFWYWLIITDLISLIARKQNEKACVAILSFFFFYFIYVPMYNHVSFFSFFFFCCVTAIIIGDSSNNSDCHI